MVSFIFTEIFIVYMYVFFYHDFRIINTLAAEQARKQKLAFLPVSIARRNKLYIFRQCTYIVFILQYQKSKTTAKLFAIS